MNTFFGKIGIFLVWVILLFSILLTLSYSGAQSTYRNTITLDIVVADAIGYTLLFGILIILVGEKRINRILKQSYINNTTAYAIFASINAPMFSLATSLYFYSQESFKVIYSKLFWYEVIPNVIFFIVCLLVAFKNNFFTSETDPKPNKFIRSKLHLIVMSGFIVIDLFSIPPLIRKLVRTAVFHHELPVSQFKYLIPVSLLPIIIAALAYWGLWATFIRRTDSKKNRMRGF